MVSEAICEQKREYASTISGVSGCDDVAYATRGLRLGRARQKLAQEYNIELIAPNRQRRSQTQDRRQLRRYRCRWKVERLFAWMHHFRRLVTRWEYHIENFLGFVQLACLHLLLRHL